MVPRNEFEKTGDELHMLKHYALAMRMSEPTIDLLNQQIAIQDRANEIMKARYENNQRSG